MALFVFETITAEQAASLSAADYLIFGDNVTARSVVVGGVDPSVTLTVDGHAVAFPAAALIAASQDGRFIFNDGSSLLLGTNGADSFAGTPGDDVIQGLAGNDALDGAYGHDYIFGGDGADTIHGGDGNDHLYGRGSVGPDGADLIFGDDGSDYLQGNAGADTLDGGAGSDRVYGGAGNDWLIGGSGNDTMVGAGGDDVLAGGADNDSLRGGAGNDLVQGESGDDVVLGSQGNDTLVGGTGFDMISGGPGMDLFRFVAGDAAYRSGMLDTITDFTDGQDHISLGFTVASVLQGGTAASIADAFAHAQALAAATPGEQEVVVAHVEGAAYLFFAGGGAGAVDSAIQLNGVDPASFGVADFI